MARFLFLVFTDPGHLHPFIGVAQSLEREGHELGFASPQAGLRAAVARAGLRGKTITEAPGAAASRSFELGQRLANPAWVVRFLRQTLIDPAPTQVPAMRAAIASFDPDVVVVDPMFYAGCIAAELDPQRPWAALSTGFFALVPPGWSAPVVDSFAKLASPQQRLLDVHGVSPRMRLADVVSPWLNVVFTSEALVPRALSGNTYSFHVGPALPQGVARGDEPAFPWERLPADRPIVYVAFGSQVSPPLAVYEGLFSALAPDEAHFVVSLKELADQPFARTLPDHVVGVRYAPQLALLARTAVMVTHAGANSVMECLSNGVPMVCVPIVHDQPIIARLVEASGAAAMLELAEVNADSARAALLPMLADDAPSRRRARELASSFTDGGARSAELLAVLARDKRPLSPEIA